MDFCCHPVPFSALVHHCPFTPTPPLPYANGEPFSCTGQLEVPDALPCPLGSCLLESLLPDDPFPFSQTSLCCSSEPSRTTLSPSELSLFLLLDTFCIMNGYATLTSWRPSRCLLESCGSVPSPSSFTVQQSTVHSPQF